MKPFDAEAAKRGEPICHMEGTPRKYIAGPDAHGTVCTLYGNEALSLWSIASLRMAPLAQVEGKDVYPGDVLYGKGNRKQGVAEINGVRFIDRYLQSWNDPQGCGFTWTPPPKTERFFFHKNAYGCYPLGVKESRGSTPIARIRINGEWHDISEGFEVEVNNG